MHLHVGTPWHLPKRAGLTHLRPWRSGGCPCGGAEIGGCPAPDVGRAMVRRPPDKPHVGRALRQRLPRGLWRRPPATEQRSCRRDRRLVLRRSASPAASSTRGLSARQAVWRIAPPLSQWREPASPRSAAPRSHAAWPAAGKCREPEMANTFASRGGQVGQWPRHHLSTPFRWGVSAA
jgi:hypothetical protein